MQKSYRRMPDTHPGPCRVAHKFGLFAACLLLPSACGGVELTNDALTKNLPAVEGQVCRDAVQSELAHHNVSPDWVRRIHYQEQFTNRSGTSSRIIGYEAWVYPKEGKGALVIELTESCQVRRIWAHGAR